MTELGSRTADAEVARLVSVRGALDVYYLALSGRRAHLLPQDNINDPVQWPDSPTTIRLPAEVGHHADLAHNRGWYKLALGHRAAHYEAGTFDFAWDRRAGRFSRLLPETIVLPRHEIETDLEQLFRMFTFRTLAIDLFTIVEDLRIDTWLGARYPGLRGPLERARAFELGQRPDPTTLAPRGALVELTVRASLGAAADIAVPDLLQRPVQLMTAVMNRLREPGATVEDTVEGMLRVYCLVTGLPNLTGKGRTARLVRPAATDLDEVDWGRRFPEPERVRLEGDSVLDTPVRAVGFRDALGVRFTRYDAKPPPGRAEILRTVRGRGGADLVDISVIDDEDGEVRKGPPEPLPHEHHEYGSHHFHAATGELVAQDAREFVYPEWDHRAGEYLQRWCRVRERTLPPGSSTRFFDSVIRTYAPLVPELRRSLERLVVEGLVPVRAQTEGDDLDLEAAIEALVDLRAGVAPDDGVYVRMQRSARDVAVAFLLDLSSSTAERLAAPDPGSQGQRAALDIHGKGYRRVIDVAKEAVALLMAAFDATGDTCGLFGFSGTGRAQVEVEVIKDLDERLNRVVASRVDALVPRHTTRMGAAIRHVGRRLGARPERTKLVMVISDGRPYDLDYGQRYGDGAEGDYAIHDTRAAIDEVRDQRVRPFLLTVDQGGQDYLRDLCGDLDYDVLDDVEQLPSHLLELYRRLLR